MTLSLSSSRLEKALPLQTLQRLDCFLPPLPCIQAWTCMVAKILTGDIFSFFFPSTFSPFFLSHSHHYRRFKQKADKEERRDNVNHRGLA